MRSLKTPAYIYQLKNWPHFTWEQEIIAFKVASVRHHQGRLLGRMESMGFQLLAEANLNILTLDVLKSSEIEGIILNPDHVRSAVAKRLGIDIAGFIHFDRDVEGVVEMMLDATQNYKASLTHDRLFGWHAALFPTGRSGMHKIVAGKYRKNAPDDPMQVVSGSMGKEKVHFQAPDSTVVKYEMTQLLNWLNANQPLDPVLKAALIHLWFITIHPFEYGNGRIARAITDMQLSRADQSQQRFYSMSSQIRIERKKYYDILEKTQKGSLDITEWIDWFLSCLDRAVTNTNETLGGILKKARFWERHSTTAFNDRQRVILNKLFDGFEGKLTSSKWAKITKASQDTAGRDINDLVSKKILIKEPDGGRSTSYTLNSNLD
jgi:Fic family protein